MNIRESLYKSLETEVPINFSDDAIVSLFSVDVDQQFAITIHVDDGTDYFAVTINAPQLNGDAYVNLKNTCYLNANTIADDANNIKQYGLSVLKSGNVLSYYLISYYSSRPEADMAPNLKIKKELIFGEFKNLTTESHTVDPAEDGALYVPANKLMDIDKTWNRSFINNKKIGDASEKGVSTIASYTNLPNSGDNLVTDSKLKNIIDSMKNNTTVLNSNNTFITPSNLQSILTNEFSIRGFATTTDSFGDAAFFGVKTNASGDTSGLTTQTYVDNKINNKIQYSYNSSTKTLTITTN